MPFEVTSKKPREIQKYHEQQRTEEVQAIIDRMPTRFGYVISLIVGLVFVLLLLFGFVIRYPDVVRGEITLNTTVSPLKLVAVSSGKLKLKILKSQIHVKEGDVIAYIENTASLDTLEKIANLLNDYNPLSKDKLSILKKLPNKVSLGELTGKYYTFLENLHQLQNFETDSAYHKQINSLTALLQEQKRNISANNERVNISKHNLLYTHKLYARDSIMYKEKVISEEELDRSQLNYLNSKDNFQGIYTGQINVMQSAKQTESQIIQTEIQMQEKQKELALAIVSSYNDLKDNINLWHQQYVFLAPFSGTVQFLNFWTNGQFIQSGQPVFTVIPENNQIYGQVALPAASGAGKVKKGQEVIIKLENFPYLEYGSIKGKVEAISLTTNTKETQQGNIETYLISVSLPKVLTTNYGKQLDFKQESKGTAEIITHNRKLIERFFDGLKYVIEK